MVSEGKLYFMGTSATLSKVLCSHQNKDTVQSPGPACDYGQPLLENIPDMYLPGIKRMETSAVFWDFSYSSACKLRETFMSHEF